MKLESKIKWMEKWCKKQGLILNLDGEVGFGRPCIGVLSFDETEYPDYKWYDKTTYKHIDNNGEVWIPERAYHKHECVAVLKQDEESINQLYRWLKWFDKNNFVYEYVDIEEEDCIFFKRNKHHRMVKK